MKKQINIFIVITLIIVVIIRLVDLGTLSYNFVMEETYDYEKFKMDRYNYISMFSNDIDFNKFDAVPEWCFISSKENLYNNELGIDLSYLDVSEIDFSKNNIIVAFGCKIDEIKKSRLISFDNELCVSIKAKKYNKNILSIYAIGKVNIKENMLYPRISVVN